METLNVLVADDELGMRLGVQRTLRRYVTHVEDVKTDVRFAVQQVESGDAALEVVEADPPDILLLDYKMPGLSGLEVLDRIRDLKLDMLTVMITAYASIETAVTATKRGAYDFLAKPFTPDELKATIRKAAARIILAKHARKLAQERKQVRFQFIRVLGHELKAPLGAIEGYLNMMKDQTLGSDFSAYGDMVQRSCKRIEGMRKLIVDLLDMTRIESGRLERQLEDVDLVEAARSAIENFTPDADARGIRISLDAGNEEVIRADRREVDMIFNNLISNAVKYNRDGGKVDVSLARDGEAVELRVADTGIGMSKKEQEKLFGEFVRIRNAKTQNILGSGLGLSILKKLVQLYGGEVVVESEPDVGTAFSLTLKNSVADANDEQPKLAAATT
jgi:two-component system sensor histidine kinase/response regulator